MEGITAIHCTAFGRPATLELVSVPVSGIRPGHCRVAIEYCGIGFPDTLILAGQYQIRLDPPFIPGSEFAGMITEVADDVTEFEPGDRVVGLDQRFSGGLAEEIVTPADSLTRLPDSVPTRAAAAMAVNYATALYALRQRTWTEPGERALVLGASGNLGIAAVELLRALGLEVLAACSSRRKLDAALSHGAHDGFIHTEEPIREAIARLTGGRGLDLVFDPVGGPATETCLRTLRPNGRLLSAGFASGEIPCLPMNLPLLKNCSVVGVFLSTQIKQRNDEFRRNLADIFAMYASGSLRPEIVEVDCFNDVACGIGLVNERDKIGKIVMRIGTRAARHAL